MFNQQIKTSALSLCLMSCMSVLYSAEAFAQNGKSGATYSRKNGVTTRRNADGTVDVIDSQGFRPGQRSSGMRANVGSYVRSSGGSTVKRNANGTVEVIDTSSTTKIPTSSSKVHKN